jgi:hypothetical protein
MALFNRNTVLSRATTILRKNYRNYYFSEASAIDSMCKSLSQSAERVQSFDIFLSHSYEDKKGALGIKSIIENHYNHSVYIDWVDDSHLDRSNVSSITAKRIRERMKKCKCLFYATSTNASTSKWMPWEVGLMDGLKNRVAICPFMDVSNTDNFYGQEYLGIYPYITIDTAEGTDTDYLWINKDNKTYISFDDWLQGYDPYEHY